MELQSPFRRMAVTTHTEDGRPGPGATLLSFVLGRDSSAATALRDRCLARRPLSPAYGTIIFRWRWMDRIPAEDRPVWESVAGWALRGHRRVIGDGSVFKFALKLADDNSDGFVAVLLYYENFLYAVRSYERPALVNP